MIVFYIWLLRCWKLLQGMTSRAQLRRWTTWRRRWLWKQSKSSNLTSKVNAAKEAAAEVVTTQTDVIAVETEKYEAALAALQSLSNTLSTTTTISSIRSSTRGGTQAGSVGTTRAKSTIISTTTPGGSTSLSSSTEQEASTGTDGSTSLLSSTVTGLKESTSLRSTAGGLSLSTSEGPIISRESTNVGASTVTHDSNINILPTTDPQIEAIIEAINAGEDAIAAMQAALAVLNQLLAQLQAGRRRNNNQPESCQQIVQNVQLMVSALPNDLGQVFAIASTLGKQTNQWKQDSEKLRDVMTCSVDQLSFLRNQRDRLQSQLDLSWEERSKGPPPTHRATKL